jgi:hypothetical protein
MAYKITFNEDYKTIESEIYGEVVVNDVIKMSNDMADYSLKYNSYLWLYDFHGTKRKINLIDIYYLPRR